MGGLAGSFTAPTLAGSRASPLSRYWRPGARLLRKVPPQRSAGRGTSRDPPGGQYCPSNPAPISLWDFLSLQTKRARHLIARPRSIQAADGATYAAPSVFFFCRRLKPKAQPLLVVLELRPCVYSRLDCQQGCSLWGLNSFLMAPASRIQGAWVLVWVSIEHDLRGEYGPGGLGLHLEPST